VVGLERNFKKQDWIAKFDSPLHLCKVVPAELLLLMAKYDLPFNKSLKSDHN